MIATLGADATGEKPAAVLEAAGLRVVFVRCGDRFAHRIEVRDVATKAWAIALESREGTDEETWPPSPPFQQLHVEHRKEGDVVLLVGMAGRSHWSAAVDVSPDGKSLRFDIAARIQSTCERIGSEYEIRDALVAARITPVSQEGICSPADSRFEPNTAAVATLPATVCWKYSLRLLEPS